MVVAGFISANDHVSLAVNIHSAIGIVDYMLVAQIHLVTLRHLGVPMPLVQHVSCTPG